MAGYPANRRRHARAAFQPAAWRRRFKRSGQRVVEGAQFGARGRIGIVERAVGPVHARSPVLAPRIDPAEVADIVRELAIRGAVRAVGQAELSDPEPQAVFVRQRDGRVDPCPVYVLAHAVEVGVDVGDQFPPAPGGAGEVGVLEGSVRGQHQRDVAERDAHLDYGRPVVPDVVDVFPPGAERLVRPGYVVWLVPQGDRLDFQAGLPALPYRALQFGDLAAAKVAGWPDAYHRGDAGRSHHAHQIQLAGSDRRLLEVNAGGCGRHRAADPGVELVCRFGPGTGAHRDVRHGGTHQAQQPAGRSTTALPARAAPRCGLANGAWLPRDGPLRLTDGGRGVLADKQRRSSKDRGTVQNTAPGQILLAHPTSGAGWVVMPPQQ